MYAVTDKNLWIYTDFGTIIYIQTSVLSFFAICIFPNVSSTMVFKVLISNGIQIITIFSCHSNRKRLYQTTESSILPFRDVLYHIVVWCKMRISHAPSYVLFTFTFAWGKSLCWRCSIEWYPFSNRMCKEVTIVVIELCDIARSCIWWQEFLLPWKAGTRQNIFQLAMWRGKKRIFFFF